MEECQIPLTLVKIAGEFLIRPLTDIISSFFNKNLFLDLAKRVSVKPMNEAGTDKDFYTNRRPASVLNIQYLIS